MWEDEKPRTGMSEKRSRPKGHTMGSSVANMITQPQTREDWSARGSQGY